MNLGVRACTCACRVPAAGASRRFRRSPSAGLAGQVDQGRDADSAQRLPSAQEAAGLSHGSLHRTQLQAVPPRRHQAVPEGHASASRRSAPSSVAPYAPGQHGQTTGAPPQGVGVRRSSCARSRRSSASTGCREQQFRNTFERVIREPGHHGHNLLVALESRLDNMVYRMGFAVEPQGGAPARPAPPRRGERPDGRHPALPRRARARRSGSRRVARAGRRSRSAHGAVASRGAPVSWLAVDGDKAAGRMLERPDARDHSDRRAGTADRRAVLEVTT